MPKRIQRKRTKGWQMPEGAVYVGRPTKWGNPVKVRNGDYQNATDYYRHWLYHSVAGAKLRWQISQLTGKDLVCWCPLDQPCHADVLLQLANPPSV